VIYLHSSGAAIFPSISECGASKEEKTRTNHCGPAGVDTSLSLIARTRDARSFSFPSFLGRKLPVATDILEATGGKRGMGNERLEGGLRKEVKDRIPVGARRKSGLGEHKPPQTVNYQATKEARQEIRQMS
jgi:hypothetical protein